MQDFPDFDYPGQDKGSPVDRINGRPGLERIPAFDTGSSVTVQIEILKESYDEIRRIILDNEWEPDDGMRTVLLAGLGYLDARERLEGLNRSTATGNIDTHEQIETLVNDLAKYHQQYSVMKFKAFKLYKLTQVMEFNISGLRETERMWETWAARMRRQHTELQAEVIRLRSLMSEFKIGWDTPLSKEVEAGLTPALTAELEPEPPIALPPGTETLLGPPGRTSFWTRLRRFFGAD